jgi:hypothetical protein
LTENISKIVPIIFFGINTLLQLRFNGIHIRLVVTRNKNGMIARCQKLSILVLNGSQVRQTLPEPQEQE